MLGVPLGARVMLLPLLQIGVPAVVIPIAVFVGNWALRYREGYEQTAAADFILAVLIFDGAVVTTSTDFAPFVQDPDLQPIIFYWHIIMGFICCGLWWLITMFGEPVLADYYSKRSVYPQQWFPFLPIVLCWIGVFILLSMHVGFFVWRGVSNG